MKKLGKVWMTKSPFKGGSLSQRVAYEHNGRMYVKVKGEYYEIEGGWTVYPYDPEQRRMVETEGYRVIPFTIDGRCTACCSGSSKCKGIEHCPIYRRTA